MKKNGKIHRLILSMSMKKYWAKKQGKNFKFGLLGLGIAILRMLGK